MLLAGTLPVGGQGLMPDKAAGLGDLFQNLILGKFPRDVAPLRTSELLAPGRAQRSVVAIPRAAPPGIAIAAEFAVFHRLRTQPTQHIRIEPIRGALAGASVEEMGSPRQVLGEDLEARRHVTIRRQGERITADAAKVIREAAGASRRIPDFLADPRRSCRGFPIGFQKALSLRRNGIAPTAKLVRWLNLYGLRVEAGEDVFHRVRQPGDAVSGNCHSQAVLISGLI